MRTTARHFRMMWMCDALNVSVSGYYAYHKRDKSHQHQENQRLLVEIRIVFKKSRDTYGSPRITAYLRFKGYSCGKNRVARLMKANGIRAKTQRRYKATTNSKHSYPVAENLLSQEFIAYKPNQIWVSDITYIPTQEGWLYLATILDLFSRKVVGWSTSSSLSKELAITALQRAIRDRKPGPGLIHHSDRGIQYASYDYQAILNGHGFFPSMSGKGNCYDNACIESFFKTLKSELVYHEKYITRQEAKNSLFDYIEGFYNRRRIHSTLGYYSPEQFEKKSRVA